MIKRLINRIIFRIKNPTCELGPGVNVSRNLKVGKNCKLGRSSSLASSVTLGENVIIGENVHLKNIEVGDNSMIENGVMIVGTKKGKIILGKECYIGVNNILDSSDDITIGDFVHIAGPSTGLWCHSSAQMCFNGINLNDANREKYRATDSIKIESNVYVGGNCSIYPGVILGHHSVVGPNSAVTKNVEPNSFVGGVPAKLIKKIY